MKKSVLWVIALASFSYSAFAANLSPECQKQVLSELKTKQITPTAAVGKYFGGNLAPVVGPVCTGSSSIKVDRIDENTFKIVAVVKPHAGYDEKGLRVKCDPEDIKKQPVNTVIVNVGSLNECSAVLTKVDWYFDLND